MSVKGKGDVNSEIIMFDCKGKRWSSKIKFEFKDGKLYKTIRSIVKEPPVDATSKVVLQRK